MIPFVEAGLGNALVALVLAVVALVIGLVCRRPAMVHALWLLVLLKLVTPPLMSVPLVWPEEVPEPTVLAYDEIPVEVSASEWPIEPPAMETVEMIEESSPPESRFSAPTWQTVFGSLWLLGSLAWFVTAVRRLWRFGRLLRHARPGPRGLVERIDLLAKQLGLRKSPRILLVQGHLSPMVWAAGRVTLLVPTKLVEQLTSPALDTLLAHELAHVRRRDHWVRWLELIALGLYWWNPVVWLARRELRQAEELCCDAWVVRCLPDARREYATALVDALDFLSRPDEPVPTLGCGLGKADDLKWRLTMILRGQISPRLGWTTTLGVFALAVLLLPLVPGFSPAEKKAEPPRVSFEDIKNLDPNVRTEVEELIAKRKAEAQKSSLTPPEALRSWLGLRAVRYTSHDDDIRKLEAEIATKAARLRWLKEKNASRPVDESTVLLGVKPEQGNTIRVEINDVKGTASEVKALITKIEKALEGQKKTVTILPPRSMYGYIRVPNSTQPPKVESTERKRESLIQYVKPPTADRRIDALEKKLDAVLRELEGMRKSKSAPRQ